MTDKQTNNALADKQTNNALADKQTNNALTDKQTTNSSLFSLPQFVYVSVRGLNLHNKFSVIIWDMIFGQDLYIVRVPEGAANPAVFELLSVLLPTNVT